MGKGDGMETGVTLEFCGGPGVKLQALGHSLGERVPKTFLFP